MTTTPAPRVLSILWALLGVSLLTSQSGIDTFSLLAGLVLLFHMFKNRFPAPRRSGLEGLLVLWVVWAAISLAVNHVPLPAAAKALGDFRWMIEFFFYVAAWRWLAPGPRWLKSAMAALAIAGIYSALVFFWRWNPIHPTKAFMDGSLGAPWRSGGFYGSPMAWSHTAGPLMAFCAGLCLELWPTQWRRWVLLGLAGMTLAVIFAMTRGVWAAVLVTLPAVALLLNWRKGLITLCLVVAGVGMLTATIPSVRERALFTLDFNRTHDSERLVLWRANAEIVKDSPIFGWGHGENSRRLKEVYERLGVPSTQFTGHAHNQYFEAAAGTGLVGLGFYLLFMGLLLRLSFQTYRGWAAKSSPDERTRLMRGLSLGVLAALVCFLLGGLTEANFAISKNRHLILFLASMLFWVENSLRERTSDNL